MAVADVVISGTVLTVDDARPTAVVLSADPRAVPPQDIAELQVRATFLAGRQVYAS
jgi:predicted amidohydrolase YtcJ